MDGIQEQHAHRREVAEAAKKAPRHGTAAWEAKVAEQAAMASKQCEEVELVCGRMSALEAEVVNQAHSEASVSEQLLALREQLVDHLAPLAVALAQLLLQIRP